VSGTAYVQVYLDPDSPTRLGFRPIGADLAEGVYGSRDEVITVAYVTGDGREAAIRERLTGEPAAGDPQDGEVLAAVALSGFGWRHICEADDPAVPAGELFGASLSFGQPTIEAMLTLWERVEEGGAQRMLSLMGFPEGSVEVSG
jgi:hypothetical protein